MTEKFNVSPPTVSGPAAGGNVPIQNPVCGCCGEITPFAAYHYWQQNLTNLFAHDRKCVTCFRKARLRIELMAFNKWYPYIYSIMGKLQERSGYLHVFKYVKMNEKVSCGIFDGEVHPQTVEKFLGFLTRKYLGFHP